MVTASTVPSRSRQEVSGGGPRRGRNLGGAGLIRIDHRDQRHAAHRRQQPRVVPAEMADADDSHP